MENRIVWEGEGLYAPRTSVNVCEYFRVNSDRDAFDNGLGTPRAVAVSDLRHFDLVTIVNGTAWPPYMSGVEAYSCLSA